MFRSSNQRQRPASILGAFPVRAISLRVAALGAAVVAVLLLVHRQEPAAAQEPGSRLNRMIEMLDSGQPAITGDSWTWVEQEHRPYDQVQLRQTLEKLLSNKNPQGQPILAPIVRIPSDGGEVARWMIKQVLESGAMGIIVPRVDTPQQATAMVEAMRFPQAKDSKYPTPRGLRGCGCGAVPGWGLTNPADYVSRADVWPLNPAGELFAMPMIESPEGVRNVEAILDVPGVSGVIIGPSDLTMNFGEGAWSNQTTPKLDATAAIAMVAKACVAKNKACGMVTSDDQQTKRYLDMGFKFMYASYRQGASS